MSTSPVTPERIMEVVWGYAPPMIVAAAVNYRIFDILDSGSKTAADVASACGCSERGVRMILNALTAFGFVTKSRDGRFSNAPDSSAFLVSTKPGFMGGFVEFSAWNLIPVWQNLRDAVRTGKSATANNQPDAGDEFFQGLVEPIFNMSYPATQIAAKALGIAAATRPVKVLDVGAGASVWGIGIAQNSPKVTVTAADLPGVLNVTRRMAERFGLADRFSYIPGDFHTSDFGTGYTIVTIGHILHGEGVEGSRKLIKKCADALASGGTMVISEFLVNENRTGPPVGLIFAVNMLVNTENGDTFSFEEISGWLKEVGLVNPRKIEPGGAVGLVLADKP